MSREQAIKYLDSLLRDKKTPIQYVAALMSQLAELNMWKRGADNSKSPIVIEEIVGAWKLEDAGEYAGLLNQVRSDKVALCQPVHDDANAPAGNEHATERLCSRCSAPIDSDDSPVALRSDDQAGGSPKGESAAESLDPLSPPTSPEKLSQVVESKGVGANHPEDGWME